MIFATGPLLRQADRVSHPAQRFLEDAIFSARQRGINVTDNADDFTLSLDMPGVAKDQLDITIEGPVVRIASKEGAARKYRAAYELPQDIDAGRTTAKMENGVLTVVLAKLAPVDKSVRIEIA
jgi:HSP20 family protein